MYVSNFLVTFLLLKTNTALFTQQHKKGIIIIIIRELRSLLVTRKLTHTCLLSSENKANYYVHNNTHIDPLGQPTVTADRDHCFRTRRPFVRPSVRTFQNLAKQNRVKTMFATGETVSLAEWIIDDTCLICITNCKSNECTRSPYLQPL